MNNRYILGIDTSNYKTSIAVTDINGSIVCDLRKFLKVKQGEKGLRQSDALFQHVKNLPELMNSMRNVFNGTFEAVSYSSRPRPVEGSYMPVFLAGESFAKTISESLQIPCVSFSHQEGHIEAVKAYSKLADENKFLACHFSGGTTELLEVTTIESGYDIEIIGGSKDIAFGQVIDRAGVLLEIEFPCGEIMDEIAVNTRESSSLLTPIKVKDGWLNLSGIDTQIKNLLCKEEHEYLKEHIVTEIFEKIANAISKMIMQGVETSGINKIMLAGGVSSSKFIRRSISHKLEKSGITVVFDDNDLSQDNAVGISLLGGKTLWR